MKYIITFFICLLTIITACTQEQKITPDFLTGAWLGDETVDHDFDIWFIVEDGHISGQYCGVTFDASKIDCKAEGDEIDCGILLPFTSDQSSLEFDLVSCHSLKKGRARVTRIGEELLWELIEAEGKYMHDHLMPPRSVLIKLADDPFE